MCFVQPIKAYRILDLALNCDTSCSHAKRVRYFHKNVCKQNLHYVLRLTKMFDKRRMISITRDWYVGFS